MKHLFYDEWKMKRVNKIINIFGKNWFKKKQILELGCAHGDVGIEFLKLGANVIFSDAREENLKDIHEKLLQYNFTPDLAIIDQNKDYDFDKKFDLIIHMGVLYHLDNWKNDLKCALEHSNLMILDTLVGTEDGFYINDYFLTDIYGSYTEKVSIFTEESIEEELKKLGCKFIRFDDEELNSSGWFYNQYFEQLYDWKKETRQKNSKHMLFHRRMWLVIR